MRQPVLGQAHWRGRSRGQAQDYRARVRRSLPGWGRQTLEQRWLAQGTIYPDVIESAGARLVRQFRSSRITMWAACRTPEPQTARTSAQALQETKYASWASRLACRTAWSTAIRSRALALACGFWVRSSRSSRTSCAAQMQSSSKSCAIRLIRPATWPGTNWPRSFCRVPAGQIRRCDGRWAYLRLRGGAARGADVILHFITQFLLQLLEIVFVGFFKFFGNVCKIYYKTESVFFIRSVLLELESAKDYGFWLLLPNTIFWDEAHQNVKSIL